MIIVALDNAHQCKQLRRVRIRVKPAFDSDLRSNIADRHIGPCLPSTKRIKRRRPELKHAVPVALVFVHNSVLVYSDVRGETACTTGETVGSVAQRLV
jgi:hypothetical protein